jgi:hypothetical protein
VASVADTREAERIAAAVYDADPSLDFDTQADTYRQLGHKPIPYTVGTFKSVIMLKHTPARLAHDIYVHSQATKFTPVMVMAMAGFGKTTFNRNVVHELHLIDPTYSIYYFKNVDILRLDQILDSLPKRKPCIIIFDDVSYVLENLPKKIRLRILDRLTRIREVLDPEYKETPCIMFMDYHYSYALPKTFRQSNFKIYISVTDEERENMLKQMGYWNKDGIMSYIRIFTAMMRYGRFYVKNPNDDFNNGRPLVYYRDRPFRASLVSNYGELHLTLFHKIYGCEICSLKSKFDKPDPLFWTGLVKKYGYDRVYKWLRIYAYTQTGQNNLLYKDDRAVLNHIKDHHTENKIDLLDLVKVLKATKKQKRVDREAYFTGEMAKMEGREVIKVLETEKSMKESLGKAKAMQENGTQDNVELSDGEDEDRDIEALDREFDKGFILSGNMEDDEDTEDEDDEDDIDEGDFEK